MSNDTTTTQCAGVFGDIGHLSITFASGTPGGCPACYWIREQRKTLDKLASEKSRAFQAEKAATSAQCLQYHPREHFTDSSKIGECDGAGYYCMKGSCPRYQQFIETAGEHDQRVRRILEAHRLPPEAELFGQFEWVVREVVRSRGQLHANVYVNAQSCVRAVDALRAEPEAPAKKSAVA